MLLKHETKTLGHAVVFRLVMLVSPAISKDSGILTRMLYAALLAEQGVAVCIVADPAFASETSGPMGYMRVYAQHVKAEVTAGLNETETLSLLKSAAGLAKAEGRESLYWAQFPWRFIICNRSSSPCAASALPEPRLQTCWYFSRQIGLLS
jgi:hypothetical protein